MNNSPLAKRKLDHASVTEYPGAKLARVDPTVKETPAPAPTLAPVIAGRESHLLSLPHELQRLIAQQLVPPSPYLPRPHGSAIGYVPVASAMHALANLAASCSQAFALVAAIRRDPDHENFRYLAGGAEFAVNKESEIARRAVISRYRIDPDETSSSPYRLQFNFVCAQDLETCALKPDQVAHQIHTLDINCWCDMISEPTRLALLIASCTGVQRLRLHFEGPFDATILDALRNLPALRTLELHAARFPVDLYVRLAHLAASGTLESLVIEDDAPSCDQIQMLVQCGAVFGQLKFLTFKAPDLATPLCTTLAQALATLKRLESLHVGKKDGRLSPAGALALLQVARQGNKIARFGLHGLEKNTPDSECVSALTPLRTYTDLQELALSGALNDVNTSELLAMLADPALHLKVLDLEKNELSESMMCALAAAIRSNPGLCELRLAGVDISMPVAEALLHAIKAEISLLRLTLDDCNMTLSVARLLAPILYESAAMREFHLTPNEHQGEHARQIAKVFSAAAGRSSRLLHMTMGPTMRNGLALAQNRLAANRSGSKHGIES